MRNLNQLDNKPSNGRMDTANFGHCTHLEKLTFFVVDANGFFECLSAFPITLLKHATTAQKKSPACGTFKCDTYYEKPTFFVVGARSFF